MAHDPERPTRSRSENTLRLVGALAAFLAVALLVALGFWLLLRIPRF